MLKVREGPAVISRVEGQHFRHTRKGRFRGIERSHGDQDVGDNLRLNRLRKKGADHAERS